MPDKCFSGRHIAIRLKIPATHDMPLALLDQFLDFFEQRRLIFLDPHIKYSFVVVEYIVVGFGTQFGSGSES
jgi:hypothetical protein